MDKRYIGIDLDLGTVRTVILDEDRETILAAERRAFEGAEELAAALTEMLGETRVFGDRAAAAVPALDAFVRRLEFPFGDPRKIAATFRFELGARLPVSLEDYHADFRRPREAAEGLFQVDAAAVRTSVVEDLIRTFDDLRIPLPVLDQAPFVFARGLSDLLDGGILAVLGARETVVALVVGGEVLDHRLQPPGEGDDPAATARFLTRERAALQQGHGGEELPLYLIGPGVTPGLIAAFRELEEHFTLPRYPFGGGELDAEFLPALALARRAALPAREGEFNYRRGPYALKNEWTALRRHLIAAGAVLLVFLLLAGGSAYLRYSQLAGRSAALQEKMVDFYRQVFGAAPAPKVAVADLMESRIRELRQRETLGGPGMPSPLTVLREISQRIPESVKVDVRDLSYGADGIRLEGSTSSFDAVNLLARSLQESPLFREAQISDAKMSIDGKRVDFRLNLALSGEEES